MIESVICHFLNYFWAEVREDGFYLLGRKRMGYFEAGEVEFVDGH